MHDPRSPAAPGRAREGTATAPRIGDAVIAGIGPEASRMAADALRRLTDRPPEVVGGPVAGVALAAVRPWRIGVARGPAGVVALALAGAARDAGGTPSARLATQLSRAVAGRWRGGGFERLSDALSRATEHLGGDFLVIAAGGEALRVALLTSGTPVALVRTQSTWIISLTTLALPAEAAIEWLALSDRTVTAVEALGSSAGARSPRRVSRRPAQAPRLVGRLSHHAA